MISENVIIDAIDEWTSADCQSEIAKKTYPIVWR